MHAPLKVWITALVVTAIFEAVVIAFGVRSQGNARAAAFGLAAACGYALTATLAMTACTTEPYHRVFHHPFHSHDDWERDHHR